MFSSAVFWPHVAAANDGGSQGFDVERFEPSAGSTNTILNIGGARVLEHKQFAIGLSTHYMDSPLVVFDRQTGETLTAVEHQLKGELLGAIGLFDRLEVGFGLPVALLNSGDGLGMTGGLAGAYSAVSLADARLMAKYQFLSQERESPIGLSLQLQTWLPLGDAGQFTSDGSVRVEPRLMADWAHDMFRVAVNFRLPRSAHPRSGQPHRRLDVSLGCGRSGPGRAGPPGAHRIGLR